MSLLLVMVHISSNLQTWSCSSCNRLSLSSSLSSPPSPVLVVSFRPWDADAADDVFVTSGLLTGSLRAGSDGNVSIGVCAYFISNTSCKHHTYQINIKYCSHVALYPQVALQNMFNSHFPGKCGSASGLLNKIHVHTNTVSVQCLAKKSIEWRHLVKDVKKCLSLPGVCQANYLTSRNFSYRLEL